MALSCGRAALVVCIYLHCHYHACRHSHQRHDGSFGHDRRLSAGQICLAVGSNPLQRRGRPAVLQLRRSVELVHHNHMPDAVASPNNPPPTLKFQRYDKALRQFFLFIVDCMVGDVVGYGVGRERR